MKAILLLSELLAASLTANAQAVLPKQQTIAQKDSAATDSLWEPNTYSSQHSSPYRRIFEIPPGVRPGIKRRTKKVGTP
jgi:hypothetical protein